MSEQEKADGPLTVAQAVEDIEKLTHLDWGVEEKRLWRSILAAIISRVIKCKKCEDTGHLKERLADSETDPARSLYCHVPCDCELGKLKAENAQLKQGRDIADVGVEAVYADRDAYKKRVGELGAKLKRVEELTDMAPNRDLGSYVEDLRRNASYNGIRAKRLTKRVKELEDEAGLTDGCLEMIKDMLTACGEDMSATPPMNYDDAIRCVVGKLKARLDEIEELSDKPPDCDLESWIEALRRDSAAYRSDDPRCKLEELKAEVKRHETFIVENALGKTASKVEKLEAEVEKLEGGLGRMKAIESPLLVAVGERGVEIKALKVEVEKLETEVDKLEAELAVERNEAQHIAALALEYEPEEGDLDAQDAKRDAQRIAKRPHLGSTPVLDKWLSELHDAQVEVEKLEGEVKALEAENESRNTCCGKALDGIWKHVFPTTYGAWEYPGQAKAHINMKFDELKTELRNASAEVERLTPVFKAAEDVLGVSNAMQSALFIAHADGSARRIAALAKATEVALGKAGAKGEEDEDGVG